MKARDQLPGVLFDARGVEPEHLAGEAEKFPRGQLVVKKWKIGHVSQPAARFERLGLHVETADARVAGRGLDEAGEQFHQGRLAGGVGAEQGEKFAAADFERDAIDGREVAEFFHELDEFDHGLLHSSMRALMSPGSSMRKISPSVLTSTVTIRPSTLVSS